MQRYDYAIVGGGAYGLSVAYHLAKSGAQIVLFERFTIGHSNGSSHGVNRIIRQAYFEKAYAELSREATVKYWPEMENALESKLLYKNDFLHISNSQEGFKKAAEISKSFPTQKIITTQELTSKYSNFPLLPMDFQIIHDTSSGILTAGKYIERLSEYLKRLPNVVLFQNNEVKQVRDNGKYVLISLEDEQIRANKVVVTAGKWVGELVPEIKELVVPIKQFYAQLQMEKPLEYKTGRFPSFQYVSQGVGEFYLLPDKYGEGMKFGLELHKEPKISQKQIKELIEKVARSIFEQRIKKISRFEECQYTVTKSYDFIIDWVNPQTENTLVCSSCSGHGFKFAPLIGKAVSDLVLSNKSFELFQKHRHRFQIPFHLGMNLQ